MSLELMTDGAELLSPEQAELLGSLLEERGAELGAFPLSFAQQRLWFLDRMSPDEAAYNIAGAIELRGALDRAVLGWALREVVCRHEILRTVFVAFQGRPLQMIREETDLPLPEVDLSALPEDRWSAELARLARQEAERPFDLARGPLLRAVLATAGEGEHTLLLVFHHIVSDGWSSRLFARELAALYGAFLEGRPSPLPDLPLQYADYAVWQRELLRGAELARLLAAARPRLSGLPALELPADHRRPGVQRLRGRRLPWSLPAARAAELRAFCERQGATLFAGLAAAFGALLARWTGQRDLPLGFPSANRDRLEIEPLIGCFVNTLVLRLDLADAPGYRELVRRARGEALEAMALRELPFEKLVEELAVGRSLAHAPLVQALLAFQSAELDLSLPGLELRLADIDNGTAKLDLTLALFEEGGGLRGWLEYSTDLFEAVTIERFAAHLGRLLEGALADPERCFEEIPLLSEAEGQQVLREWSDTGSTAGGGLLHELFEAQAARTPEALALVVGEEWWTYTELAARADAVARRLRALGVGPEGLVGVFLERSAHLVCGLLGILKAGGAYVPLDPAYPRERVEMTLADSGARVVLTQRSLADRLPDLDFATVLAEELEAPAEPSGAWQRPQPESLAFVIYTSGSTGRPKGVAIMHRSAVVMVRWAWTEFSEEETARVFAATSICFDLSVYELFVPLLRGGAVILGRDALELPSLPARDEVTLVNTVPSAAAELVRLGGVPGSVRVVNLAGEPLRRSLVERLAELPGIERVLNLYGPTEDTTYSTCVDVPLGERREPTIGRPLAGTRVRLMGPGFTPVSLGVAGELCLAGEGLARGYLGRPELTAERFVPDPFGAVPGERMYRTGDLARHLPGGELEFLGRLDHQVKVRGFRIELGEVETALEACPGVREAVAMAREDRLLAWVMPEPGVELSSGELRAALRERLPEFMVPSALLVLAELPRTPNGKVDRKALPAPEAEETEAGFVEPRGPAEELLAAVWAGVLGVERVGATDDFFALGGHSLLAVRVLARIRDLFGVELPVRQIFEDPNVRALARRLDDRHAPAAGAPPIRRVRRDGPLPLSFSQERLWFLDRLTPGDPAYNIPVVLALHGPVDLARLQEAFAEVVRRHEALRTRFGVLDGQPVQVVDRPGDLPLPEADLSALPQEAGLRAAAELSAEVARAPFDLADGPLLRVAALCLSASEHRIVVVLHHIAADAWSLGVLFGEVARAYGDLLAGRRPELPELPVQYGDYAVWQREALAPRLAGLAASWRQRLAGIPELLELPTDHPRPPVRSSRGAEREVRLAPALAGRLRDLARAESATPFMALFAGFAALLARYGGQSDLPIGSPAATRSRSELEPLIGFFVNTLVLRADLSGGPGLRELLARARRMALDAFGHQDLPFEKLVEAVDPHRGLDRSPLFQAMLVVQNAPLPPLALPGLGVEVLRVPSRTAKVDLTLALFEEGEGLRGWLEYSTDLFEVVTMERFAAHLGRLLEGTLADPERRFEEIPLLSEAEGQQVLREWSDTGSTAGGGLLHELFEAQAARTPDALALVVGAERWTYAELAARADAVARRLRALGVGPERLVGVFLERSAHLVCGLLGILKAGGAYVPLDPAYPRERVEMTLADSDARVVLTQRSLADRLPDRGFAAVLAEELEAPAEPSGAWQRPQPESLAFVIYTSGSTGRPKGVAIMHRSAVAMVRWAWTEFSEEETARVFAATSICFDLSVYELFVPLLRGGAVILGRDALELPSLPARDEVTLVNTVPSAAAELVRLGGVKGSVRVVNLAGEPLRRSLVERLAELPGIERVLNLYGPTEDTTYSTCVDVPLGERREPTIGRPLAGTRVRLMGPGFTPVPLGVAGELCLAGEGLARGYLGRPDLTAERFVPDPFGAVPGERMYRTGDLARHLPGGELEFLGRLDHQVKVRGFRIELGEIETLLGSLAGVQESVVLAREDGTGERRLVAYVMPRAGAAPVVAELRSALRERLPEFMIPSAFVVLDQLPRTPNGKVDRKALPEPEAESGAEAYAAPRGPAEELLAEIWSEVLGVERVGATDDFFALGGHSLLAVRVVSRVREASGVDLPLRMLFEASTVAALAERVERARGIGLAATLPPIERAERSGELPPSFGQERLWFLDQLEPGSSAYNIPSAVGVTGALEVGPLARALGEIVRRHEALRTRFEARSGRPVQVIVSPAEPPLPQVDLRSLPEPRRRAEARRLAREEALRPFDLARGPLMRVGLLRLDEEEWLCLLTLHHAVSDGWSLGVLVSELSMLYAAFREGMPSPLAELEVQYADYAVWQRRSLAGPVLQAELDWWRRQLAGAPVTLELPTDHPRPAMAEARGGRERVEIPGVLLDGLERLGRNEGATLYMTLLAVFAALLSRYSGQEDLLVGSPVAGRSRWELEGLIGLFVNTVVLRADLQREPTFQALLGRVRETALSAFAHQELPFEKLVEEVAPERSLGRSPLFQVMFAFQAAPPLVQVPGLALCREAVAPGTAKFDLSLELRPEAEGVEGWIEYRRDLFEAATVRRMAGHLTTLLAAAAGDPGTWVSELPLLGAGESEQLLGEWSRSPGCWASPGTVHGLFEEQARRTPDKEAVVGQGEALTYRELDEHADKLAELLRGLCGD